jgi:tRNA threonylcarbamoyl adenosine modification protein (Sua5/YciO/YrdC/YwlC family)
MVRLIVHPVQPQKRLLEQAAVLLRGGALGVIATDAGYALACRLEDKAAVDRLRAIRQIDDRHLLTLLCRDLSELSHYAQVDNQQYRFLKRWTPGTYTFVLPATREVPRRLAHPSRKTVGMRVPDHPVPLALLEALGQPLLASTLRMPNEDETLADPDDIEERLGKRVDLIIDAGWLSSIPTTIVDLTGPKPLLRRAGLGFDAIAGEIEQAGVS